VCSSAFSGFLSESSRINSVFRKGRKWRITDLSINVEELIEDFVKESAKPYSLLVISASPSNPANYTFNLRPHGHDLPSTSAKKALFKNSFIMPSFL